MILSKLKSLKIFCATSRYNTVEYNPTEICKILLDNKLRTINDSDSESTFATYVRIYMRNLLIREKNVFESKKYGLLSKKHCIIKLSHFLLINRVRIFVKVNKPIFKIFEYLITR